MIGKIVVERTREGEFWFSVNDEDGKIVAKSGNFATLAACRSGIAALRENIGADVCSGTEVTLGSAAYHVFAEGGKYVFLLKGSYGEVLARGEGYDSLQECEAVVREMRNARIEIDG